MEGILPTINRGFAPIKGAFSSSYYWNNTRIDRNLCIQIRFDHTKMEQAPFCFYCSKLRLLLVNNSSGATISNASFASQKQNATLRYAFSFLKRS